MAQYQFPLMSVDEAVEFFSTEAKLRSITGSALTAADFRKPDPQRWLPIYGGLLELLTLVPYDSIRQEVVHLGMRSPGLEYPEICDEAAHLCLFSLYMGRLLATCGFNDFVVKDIAKPTTKRLLMIVSALVNFYKFQAGRIEVYESLKENRMRENEHYVQMVAANDELRQKINNIKAKRAEKEPQVLRLQNEIRELSTKMVENRKVEAGIRASLSEQKAKIAENEAANDQLRVQILESKKRGEKLSRQIVHSPARLKEDRKRTQANLADLRQMSSKRAQRMLELREQLERLRMVEDLDQPMKLLRAMQAEEEKEKECTLETARIQDEIASVQEAIQADCSKAQERKAQIAAKQEKIAKLSLQHQHKTAGARATLDQLTQEVEMAKGEASEKKDHLRAVYQQKRSHLDELRTKIVEKENNIERMKLAYGDSLEKLEAYHNKLAAAWERGQAKLQPW